MAPARPRILVVEDEAIIRCDLAVTLERLGYTVVGAVSTGAESIVAAFDRRPDLIMMDIAIKGPMNGIEAAGEIRRRRKIPVLFLTAYGTVSIPGEMDGPGGCSRLGKPFEEDEINAAIRRLLPDGDQ